VLKVGLTGGIACGKSVVSEMFASLGAHVTRADEIGHKLMSPGHGVYDEIVRRFGSEILDADGAINRQRLSDVVFAPGASRIKELNRIVHPAVIEEQDRWMNEIGRREPSAVVVVEAALILEAGLRSHFDRLVVVTCDPEQKVERLGRRMKMDADSARREVERRSAAQIPDADKVRQADYVIYNTGSLDETRRQADHVFAELKREAERKRVSSF
jgi:dephospho-CoA kinase